MHKKIENQINIQDFKYADWKLHKLGVIAEKISSGATPTGGKDSYKKHGISLIRSQNVYNNRFDVNGLAHIDNDQAEKLKYVSIKKNDVLLNITGDSVARCCIVPDYILPARVNQHVAIIRAKKDALSPHYLLYHLVSPYMQENMLSQAGSGATRNALTKGMIENFKIPLPPLPEQRAIADILSSLDDKIELNNRMNVTLEQMARAIFKQWFVEFEFPVNAPPTPEGGAVSTGKRAPSGGQGGLEGGYKSSGGKMIDSELGMIPEGWEVVYLPEIIDVNPTRSLKKGEIAPYLEMKNLSETSARVKAWERREFSSGTKFINGDVLLARITPCLENGKTAYVDFLNDNEIGWGSTEYIVLRSKPPIPTEYVYFLSRTDEFRNYAIKNMSGTSGRQRVNTSCFDSLKILRADEAILARFGSLVAEFLNKIKHNDEESRTLSLLRDTLLPKLMSGELRVPPEKVREYENADAPSHVPPSGDALSPSKRDRGANA
jgi:type I restriction enzyme, S subunit